MSETIKQHFVPQFLLRHFGFKVSERIWRAWAFDIRTSRSWASNVEDIGHENGFYEASIGSQRIEAEPLLKLADDEFAPVVNDVIQNCALPESPSDQLTLAVFVATQRLRVPRLRNDIEATRKYIVERFGPDVHGGESDKTFGEITANDDRLLSIRMFRQVPRYASILRDKCWFLLTAPNSYRFIISDNPVSLHNEVDAGLRGNLGIGSFGIQVYVPISPTHCLMLICADYLKHRGAKGSGIWHCRGRPADLRNVDFVNQLQLLNAERFVYARDDTDFGIVRQLLAESPDLRRPSSERSVRRE